MKKDFYEDSESRKMMSIIQRQYREERAKKYQKKENRKEIAIIILGVILALLVLGLLIVHFNKETNDLVNQCVKEGNSLRYCQNKYYIG